VKSGRNDGRPGAQGRLTRRAARAYQGVLETVLTLPAGALLGYGLDAWLGTTPIGVLVGLVLGFAAFVAGAVRLARRLNQNPDEDESPREEN